VGIRRIDQIWRKRSAEVRNAKVSFRDDLDEGEKLSGPPTVSPESGLTVDNEQVSVKALRILGEVVNAGEAVQYRISGGTHGQAYDVTITVDTNASPPQTLEVVSTVIVDDT
jgi:hypothetical protein